MKLKQRTPPPLSISLEVIHCTYTLSREFPPRCYIKTAANEDVLILIKVRKKKSIVRISDGISHPHLVMNYTLLLFKKK